MKLRAEAEISKELLKHNPEYAKEIEHRLHHQIANDLEKIFKAKSYDEYRSRKFYLEYHAFSDEVLREVLNEIQDAVKDCFGSIPLSNFIYDRLMGNTTLTFKEMGFKTIKG